MPTKLLYLALAGSMGTLARYGLSGLVHRISGAAFPWGTLVVNVTGCFLAGLLWTLFESRWPVSGETRATILVGFMGAFTTFSSLILESSHLLRSAEWFFAVANVTMHTGLGFVAVFAGIALARMI